MAGTRANRERSQPGNTLVSVDVESVAGDSETDLVNEIGAFDALFEGYEGANVRVTLRRLQPEHWQDPSTGEFILAKGYLESLPPALPDYEAYIRAKYGGGKYLASKIVDGRYRLNRHIDISGPPIFANQGAAPGALPRPAQPAQTSPATGSGVVTVDGIPLDGSDDLFMRRMERAAQIKLILGANEPKDINSVILQHMLKTQSPNPFESFQQFAQLLETAKDMVGNGGGGSDGWLGLADKALGLVNRLPALRMPPAPGVEPQTAKEPESMAPDPRELANQALGLIVGSFRRKNRPEPLRVANALNSMFPVPQKDRRTLFGPHFDWLDVNGGAALSEDFLDNPDLEDAWTPYLKAVFDAYCGVES